MGQESHSTSASRGGVKGGDRADTGDLEARPTRSVDRSGSGAKRGPGHVTGDPSALGAHRGPDSLAPDEDMLDELTVKDADDPDLGLTDIGDVPPDDWAADTGPTLSAEEKAPSRK
jgi:hypothetical protein